MTGQAGRLFRNPSLALAPAENGYWAYDIQTARLHRLNPVAALILELSDGSHTVKEISADVAPLLQDDQSDACARWIASAVDSGLLCDSASTLLSSQPDAAAFASAADNARADGYVLAAFVCQHHAALLAPDEADYWEYLGELAHIVQRRADARAAYERYIELHGSDAEVEHILISLRDEAPPPRASDSCIQQLYSRFSSFYEKNMLGDLDYQAPARLAELLEAQLGELSDLQVLDLGCGTGLGGRVLRPRARSLAGIDLSPGMIAQAQATGLYDTLEVAEITGWLSRAKDPVFSLIAACDTLIYFGDLRQVLVPGARRLTVGGWVAFTVEKGETIPFRLTDSGRYQHSKTHIIEAAADAGLVLQHVSEGLLRYEYGEEVKGWVVLLKKTGAGAGF
jgi:predicted TPR repeat methyltransferase